jgi:hypothetical protein
MASEDLIAARTGDRSIAERVIGSIEVPLEVLVRIFQNTVRAERALTDEQGVPGDERKDGEEGRIGEARPSSRRRRSRGNTNSNGLSGRHGTSL